ncbi:MULTISPECIES: MocR-like pyridoxine biosynthesis transcription factor PdxR [Streptomycetaceae]|uniref:MocR-like pyridoxine biosynthesis transcription factor PdxR n=1 Tax=Streptomycetaceae TaxID=2062 RepID=UPI00093CBE32|nr:PLP-dependent aminotransferase family protein [Streptomyces sp. CB02056]OKI02855.1 GntR family transcriptional regulator [Streptomyces sp. CB02056]
MNRSKAEASDRSKEAGADFLQLDTAEAPPGGLTDWLARRLREAVADGRLPVGARLPAGRVLAAELGVSRGVVTDAYRRLAEEGQIAGRGRGGTVVVAATAVPVTAAVVPGEVPAARPPRQVPALFRDDPDPEVFERLRGAPARIDLTPGVPDLAAFPRAAWLRAERAVLDGLAASDLGYGDVRGTPVLRRAVAHWLARNRGIRADPDEVLIVAGTAQALALLGRALGRAGIDEVAVEDPGSVGVRQHLAHWLAATPPVPVDAEGVRVDALRATGAPAVLLTPAHQFPTGVVLGGERRRELLRWAAEGGLVIEDDYDAEHRYDRPPVPALRAVLPDRVCYAGSVSKLLAPALRTGWLLVPDRLRDAVLEAKRFVDLGNPVLPQLVLARLMESGDLDRHLRLLRRRHRRRRDAMIDAIRTHLPGATVHGAAAGLHLMLTLPEGCGRTDTGLAAAALAEGVKVQPLSWHARLPHPPGLVLGYAAGSVSEIAEGVAVLGRLVGGAASPRGD